MQLNEKIFTLRKRCGLSQEALGDAIGVSRQAVSKWETGDALPEVTKLKALAEVFGVTVDFLLDDNDGTDENDSVRQADAKAESNSQTQNQSKASQSTFGIHTTNGGTADRLSIFVLHYGWLGGVILIIYGLYRTVAGVFSVLTAIGSTGIFNQVGMLPAGLTLGVVSLTNLAVGILLTVAGVFIVKKYKPNTGSKVAEIILTVGGVITLLMAAILFCNSLGALDVINLGGMLPYEMPLGAVSVVFLAASIALLVAGIIKIKKNKNKNE